jgi:hypothetical protein
MAKSRSVAIAGPFLWAVGMFFLAGCESDRVANIPPGASVMSSGNQQLTYSATQTGTIWVYDVNSDRIIYSGGLAGNQSVSVDPVANQITVDGRIVFEKGLNNGDQVRIYFQPTAQ